VYTDSNICDTLGHSVEVSIHYVHMRFIVMFNYDYLVVENDDTKIC
jgi:hypothetical protein